jgi:protein TonB
VASTTQYGAVISAAIRARTVFPQSARGSGGGVVLVAFVIGPSGRAVSASVARSSGDAALDRAALAAVRGVAAPPPPGGRYAATAPIRFNLQ